MRWFKENRFKILFNLLAVFFIFLCAEYVLYLKHELKTKDGVPFLVLADYFRHKQSSEISKYFEYLNADYYKLSVDKTKDNRPVWSIMYRNPVGLNYKNKPILLFGCSFGWGVVLNENQTFQYKLSQLTKRPVYNRAISGWGIQHMLYHLKQRDFYSTVPKPEYVIYLFIPQHISRLYKYNFINGVGLRHFYNYLKYNEHNGRLYEEKRLQYIPYSRIWNWCILPYIARIEEKNTEKSFELLRLHWLECRKEIDKHWGKDVKFIIFDYETKYKLTGKDILDYQQYVQKLKEDRIYVIKTSQLTDVDLDDIKYHISADDHHPNEKAWNLLTPLFVKKVKEMGL